MRALKMIGFLVFLECQLLASPRFLTCESAPIVPGQYYIITVDREFDQWGEPKFWSRLIQMREGFPYTLGWGFRPHSYYDSQKDADIYYDEGYYLEVKKMPLVQSPRRGETPKEPLQYSGQFRIILPDLQGTHADRLICF